MSWSQTSMASPPDPLSFPGCWVLVDVSEPTPTVSEEPAPLPVGSAVLGDEDGPPPVLPKVVSSVDEARSFADALHPTSHRAVIATRRLDDRGDPSRRGSRWRAGLEPALSAAFRSRRALRFCLRDL